EMTVHPSLAPNPDGIEEQDDDVDSLDVVKGRDTCPYWYFTADHEAFMQLDPGDIYEVTAAGAVLVVDDVIHLGIPDETDVDAFEFVAMEEPDLPGQYFLAVVFSVDNDDSLTVANESGGLDPTAVYASFLTGYSFQITDSLGDDIDALTCYREPLPRYLCGDANCDGVVDVFDIDAFVLAITNPAAYQAIYPCFMNCDTNCDGSIDVFDIDSFVAAVTGTPCNCGY
ncbi:MAG: hypothetical protein JXO22_02610, partial [Phycisphaerae bacterium]|nr:hypothetical protein [Phycisphaerae bacterium]